MIQGRPGNTGIRCDRATRDVWLGDERIDPGLSVQEFDLLTLLCERPGEVRSRDELGAAIWGAGNFEYNMLHRLVHRTKRKLETYAPGGIVAIPRVGYKIAPGAPDGGRVERTTAAAPAYGAGTFFGRDEELERLREALDLAIRNSAVVLAMLTGEPGVGKTTTAAQFAAEAGRQHAVTLTGACYEGEGTMPYAPVLECLRGYIATQPEGAVTASIAPDAAELMLVLPELRRRFPDVEPTLRVEPDLERLRLFRSIGDVVQRFATRAPLVMTLDDLQWADKATVLLVQYLVKQVKAPVLVVGTYRDFELERGHPLMDALAAWHRTAGFQLISLGGLAPVSLARMFPAEAPDALVSELFQHTQGNPFFAREIIEGLLRDGTLAVSEGGCVWSGDPLQERRLPANVRAVLEARLSRLSEVCRRVVSILAVTREGLNWETLRTVSGLSEDALLDALDEALDERVLEEGAPGRFATYDFSHALLRHTLYASLSAARRTVLHATIGEALERTSGAVAADSQLPEIAYHFSRSASSGDPERAIDYLRRAADLFLRLSAYEEAVSQLERALSICEGEGPRNVALRCDLLLALGDAFARAGDSSKARDALFAAANLAREMGAADRLAAAALALDPAWSEAGVLDEPGLALIEEAVSTLGEADSTIRAKALASLAGRLYYTAPAERRLGLSSDALAMAQRLGDAETIAYVLFIHHRILSLRVADAPAEVLSEQLQTSTELVRLAEKLGDGSREFQGRVWRIIDLFQRGDIDAVDAEERAATALCERLKQPAYDWLRAGFRAARTTFSGDLADAEVAVRDALAAGQRAESVAGVAMQVFALQTFALRWEQDRLAEIEPIIRAAVARYPSLPAFRSALAFMFAELGRDDEARAEYQPLVADDLAALPRDGTWVGALTTLSQVCWLLRDSAGAESLYGALLPHRAHCILIADAAICMGAASRYLGLTAATAGMWAEAEGHFQHAIEFNSRLRSRSYVARCQYEYAWMLRERSGPGDAERAAGLLASAQAVAVARHLTALQTKIERLTGAPA
jgi:tetratricopeptide (TPR) repeat protein